jgi:hypothetical protein
LSLDFEAGIDAAVNAGDGKLYFFKDGTYARLTFATRSVDRLTPPYPRPIRPAWDVVPFPVDAAVEWVQAGKAPLDVFLSPTGCQRAAANALGQEAIGQGFIIRASFSSTGYPSLCGCAEYRQFVRGSFIRNGKRSEFPLPNPAGGDSVPLLPRPVPGAADDNFREDGNENNGILFYGHRDAPADRTTLYRADQRSGCRFEGIDSPLLNGDLGDRLEVDLDFRGVIIDVAAGGEIIAEKRWCVFCSGVM